MVFKRRDRPSLGQRLKENVWPRRGWRRGLQYLNHRLRRLPDPPHRIARGVFAGVWVSFLPLFGLDFLVAAGFAWLIRGNLVAAVMGSFVSNPLTFPFIATFSIELGNWMLGHGGVITPFQIATAFGQAGAEISANFWAVFTHETVRWDRLHRFWDRVFWPYLIGSMGPGIVAGLVGYYLTLPLVSAYQKVRRKRLAERFERHQAARAALTDIPPEHRATLDVGASGNAGAPGGDPAAPGNAGMPRPDGGDAGGGTA